MTNAPLRITCVTLEMGCGGVQRAVQSLTARLADAGHTVSLVLMHGDTPDFFVVDPRIHRTAPVSGGWEHYGPLDVVGRWRRVARIRRLIRDTSPDVVISHEDVTNVEVLIALAGTGIPVMACEHMDPRCHAIPRQWDVLRRLVYPRARTVVMLTDDLTRWALTRWPRWRAVTVPNIVEPAPPPAATCPVWLGPRTVIAVGRLVPAKGFDLLLEAFALVSPQHPTWRLVIAGEGAERDALEAQIAATGLAGQAQLVGQVPELRARLPHAGVFVLSSRYESFGIAVVEAMAAGLPVVSFACPAGPVTLVRDGIDGVLVPPQDPASLAAALSALMADPDRRRQLGREARTAAQRYAPEVVMAHWQALLSQDK